MTTKSRTVMARPGVRTLLGMVFVLAVAVLVADAVISTTSTRRLAENNRRVNRAAALLVGLERVLSTLKGAETDLLGYLLTGRGADRDAYAAAVATIGDGMRQSKALLDDPVQQRRFEALESKVQEGLATMREAE